MPYNVPTITTNDISFGPAVLYMGVSGATPSIDVGAISEDGVNIEVTSEKKIIYQGNPKTPCYTFSQTQGVKLGFTSIEWDFTHLAYALGAAATYTDGSDLAFAMGGDPLVTEVAVHIKHYMAVTGNTMNVYMWKMASEGGFSIPFGQDEHSFEMNFIAMRSATDWGGTALNEKQQLMRLLRDVA